MPRALCEACYEPIDEDTALALFTVFGAVLIHASCVDGGTEMFGGGWEPCDPDDYTEAAD